jgi:uncharacterized membrane protein
MDTDLIVPAIFRWLHIGPVIVAIGGAFFARYVIIPSMRETLSDEQREQVRSAIIRRWKRVLHICIALILISGSYNFYRSVSELEKPPLYHMLFLPKFLAALGIFFIGIALVGKSEAFENMRRENKKWLGILIALAVVIVLISGVMKNLPKKVTGNNGEPETALQWSAPGPGLI